MTPKFIPKIEITETISQVPELLRLLSDGYVFRGHADSKWSIDSSLNRESRIVDKHKFEIDVLQLFRSEINQWNPNFNPKATDFDCIQYLQHHGCPTRCLDVTKCLLTAIYFALHEAEKHPVSCVWAFNRSRLPMKSKTNMVFSNTRVPRKQAEYETCDESIPSPHLEIDPNVPQIFLHTLSNSSPRMEAQKALCLMPCGHRKLEDYLCLNHETTSTSIPDLRELLYRSPCSAPSLIKIDFGFERRKNIIRMLESNSISQRNLMLDCEVVDKFVRSLPDRVLAKS